MAKQYETVIGLEVHVELATDKNFLDERPHSEEHQIHMPGLYRVCRSPRY